jgi:hypothetical protein
MIQGRFSAWGWLVRDEKESDSYLLRLLRSDAWGWLAPPQAATFGSSLRWRRPDPGHRGALDSGGGRIQASSAFHPKRLLSTLVRSPAHAPAPALEPAASMAGAVEEQGSARRCCGGGDGRPLARRGDVWWRTTVAATERSREQGGPKIIGGGRERVLGPPVGTRGSHVVLPAERAGAEPQVETLPLRVF